MNAQSHTRSPSLFSSRSATSGFLCALVAFLLLTGCNISGAPPCAEDADCMKDEICLGTYCHGIQRKPKTATGPACKDRKPSCLSKGVCSGVTPVCVEGRWQCKYPSSYQREEDACDGKDNDCDGHTDEGCSCQPGETQKCGSSQGQCRQGTQVCNKDGQWGACTGAITAKAETCNGKDDDCDGNIDEDITRSCYDGPAGTDRKGACQGGTQTCTAGKWSACTNAIKPSPETCNGKDDDCDGLVDEDIFRSCYTGPSGTQGQGTCKAGVQTCMAGDWSACAGEVLPSKEVCNGKDDDCDGEIDEQVFERCYNGAASTRDVGSCKTGTRACINGDWGACTGEVLPAQEVCNGKDDDCDGLTDEDLVRACYTGPEPTQNVGSCKGGTQTCSAGKWSACAGEVTPKTETCDGKDDDCDGQTDEGSQLCGDGKTCQSGACVCDSSKGYYPYNGTCLKVGQACPASLRNGGTHCPSKEHWMVCNPHDRVEVLKCALFNYGQCTHIAGRYGCKARPEQYDVKKCMRFNAGVDRDREWNAVVHAVGLNKDNAVIAIDPCSGSDTCGTLNFASRANATTCLCGERTTVCDGYTHRNPMQRNANGQCVPTYTNFGCKTITNPNARTCRGKHSYKNFPMYTCE